MPLQIFQRRIHHGLDIPVVGEPRSQEVKNPSATKSVGLLGSDFVGLSPSFLVKAGQRVSLGQKLFIDKKNEKVCYAAPAAGTIREIYRGERRSFISLVIDVDAESPPAKEKPPKVVLSELVKYDREQIIQTLIESGQWPLLRMRPFGCVPHPEDTPSSLFINAMDTHPLSLQHHLRWVFDENIERVQAGLQIASILIKDAPIHWVQSSLFGTWKDRCFMPPTLQLHIVDGKHPAGVVGTHIHLIDPVGPQKKVWHISLQGLIAMGGLFLDGIPYMDRVISLGGSCVKNPRLIRTRVGVNLQDLLQGELSMDSKQCRVISGSLLGGSNATSSERSFLGFYDQQVCVIPESQSREFMGMVAPGWGKFSLQNVFFSAIRKSKFLMTACQNGSLRAMVPIGSYEKVMPFDIPITPFLRCLLTQNVEKAVEMGALELVEEDLSLCTFVCQSKHNYGPLLRNILNVVQKEGLL